MRTFVEKTIQPLSVTCDLRVRTNNPYVGINNGFQDN